MLRDEQQAILRLPEALGQRVLGQDHAINEVCEQLKINRAGLEDPAKPIGVFLLVNSVPVSEKQRRRWRWPNSFTEAKSI